MVAIQNQQTDLLKYVSLNGTEITVGGVRYTTTEVLNVFDFETAAGRKKRYAKNNKKNISINYTYIASSSEKTVDGREGRDFIYNLAANAPYVLVSYKDTPFDDPVSFYGYIDNYSESIIRRDPSSQCIYYDINFEIVEA